MNLCENGLFCVCCIKKKTQKVLRQVFFLVERGTGERKRTKEIVTAARSCKRVKGHKIQFPTMSIYVGRLSLFFFFFFFYITSNNKKMAGQGGRKTRPSVGRLIRPERGGKTRVCCFVLRAI